ncbi:penicillin-binding protein 2 [Protaetiibacter sp. SSC-01]|uniref:peptidoglycan D,D-transpeptidase FtsI family protein n=1 Tax=Protaetiibacter sp. SSC-01 TaxID=2759943 RepID=UPI001657641B|nr:penicillin-binding protein 2 [Protaetiibacter sp. SSC-01]QNO36505.1 penicillin-binding protein 2 [Protaetiibacter sp. SSC-01]
MIEARRSRRRLAVAVLAVFAIVAVFSIRLVDIQLVRADTYREAAGSNYYSATLWGTRGSIVDANGTVLATSVDRFNITAAPINVDLEGFYRRIEVDGEKRTEHVGVMEALGEISDAVGGADVQAMFDALTADPDAPWALLVKAVDLEAFKKVKKLGIPWVYSEPQPARSYPNGAIAGNLVGLMGRDRPLSGTELQWDECLASENGQVSYTMSEDGVRMPGSEVVEQPATNGGTVHLTIDSDLQWFAQQALAEQGAAIGAEWATAFVVEVKTGKIRAAADWPAVDPNDLNSASAEDAGARSFVAPFEPGSVIKAATVASLLDAGLISRTTPFTVKSSYTVPGTGTRITDSFWHGDVNYTTAGILVNSSNIGIAQMSELMPLERRIEYLKAFGFGSQYSGADFLGESKGFVRSVSESDPVTAVAQQFGQGMTATSAQVASLYQTLANGGVRIPLTLVEGCELPDGTYTGVPDPQGTRVVSEQAADDVVTMLEGMTTQHPYASQLAVPGYRIAAKSGTAEVASGNAYGTDRIVSMAGMFPVDDPQYAVVVTFAKPVTMKTSAAAVPTFNAIIKQVIKTYRVTPSTVPAPDNPLTW